MANKLWKPGMTEYSSQQRKGTKRRMPKAFVRAMAKHVEGQSAGNFRCPECGEQFHNSYGKFGRFETFGQNELHCRDCACGITWIPG